MRVKFCEWEATFVNEGEMYAVCRAGVSADKQESPLHPLSTVMHCDALWCTVMHCDAPKSAEVSSATLHFEWRAMQWLIAVFIHTGSFIHWPPEKHFSHSETRLVFQTLPMSSPYHHLFKKKLSTGNIYLSRGIQAIHCHLHTWVLIKSDER